LAIDIKHAEYDAIAAGFGTRFDIAKHAFDFEIALEKIACAEADQYVERDEVFSERASARTRA
jgi:hypothetical protein